MNRDAQRDLKFKKKNQKLRDYLLTRDDMRKINNIHTLLTHLYIFTTTLGGSKFVTISFVLSGIKSVIKLLEAKEDDPIYICEM